MAKKSKKVDGTYGHLVAGGKWGGEGEEEILFELNANAFQFDKKINALTFKIFEIETHI